jgi:hypothetical protein
VVAVPRGPGSAQGRRTIGERGPSPLPSLPPLRHAGPNATSLGWRAYLEAFCWAADRSDDSCALQSLPCAGGGETIHGIIVLPPSKRGVNDHVLLRIL